MKYFTDTELTVTGTDLPNIPNEEQENNLHILVEKLLDPIREMWGKPIMVNSAFRSEEVNEQVGGVATSQHCKGQAADLHCDDNKGLFEMIKEHFEFDQLINEHNFSWVHVSYNLGHNRKQVLKIT
ncbi:MAG: D-Ala-D-Ala carboxypeptidase family metallohydrolase [Smithella sp.]